MTDEPDGARHATILRRVEATVAEARAGLRTAERIHAESPKTAKIRALVGEIERLADHAWLAALDGGAGGARR